MPSVKKSDGQPKHQVAMVFDLNKCLGCQTCTIACSRLSRPHTFSRVSCCPANDASGRSSAVADERTATENVPSGATRQNRRCGNSVVSFQPIFWVTK